MGADFGCVHTSQCHYDEYVAYLPPLECILNVAGSRESQVPGIQEAVFQHMVDLLIDATDEGLWRHSHQSLFPSKPVGEPYQDISRYIVEASWSNFTLLVEGQLFFAGSDFPPTRRHGIVHIRKENANRW